MLFKYSYIKAHNKHKKKLTAQYDVATGDEKKALRQIIDNIGIMRVFYPLVEEQLKRLQNPESIETVTQNEAASVLGVSLEKENDDWEVEARAKAEKSLVSLKESDPVAYEEAMEKIEATNRSIAETIKQSGEVIGGLEAKISEETQGMKKLSAEINNYYQKQIQKILIDYKDFMRNKSVEKVLDGLMKDLGQAALNSIFIFNVIQSIRRWLADQDLAACKKQEKYKQKISMQLTLSTLWCFMAGAIILRDHFEAILVQDPEALSSDEILNTIKRYMARHLDSGTRLQ